MKRVTTEEFDGSFTIRNEYYIEGIAEGKVIMVRSIGTIVGGKGAQIEINENGKVRYFPYFGINWVYLTAISK